MDTTPRATGTAPEENADTQANGQGVPGAGSPAEVHPQQYAPVAALGWTFGFFAVTAAVFYALGWEEGSTADTETQPWTIWKLSTALGIVLAAIVASAGIRTIRRLRTSAPSDRRPRLWPYIVAAIVVIAAVFVFYYRQFEPRDWPPGMHMDIRLPAVAITVGVAAIPWLVTVWILHDVLNSTRKPSLVKMRELWDALSSCVFAFAVLIVISLVPTGVLRAAWFARTPKPADDSYPTTDVLLYGAFWAVIGTAIALPLVVSWRRKARDLVERTHPYVEDSIPEGMHESRNRLESALNLGTGPLRNPITVLSIFTPLITATIAAFIPELSS